MKTKDEFSLEAELVRVVRASSGKILAHLVSHSQDIQLAEDALQDALLQASQQWKTELPKNTEAWLTAVAKRRLIDTYRTSQRRRDQETLRNISESLKGQEQCESSQPIPDERLKLIFTCCHPALNEKAQIALTLKTLCGLTTQEIARAFLVPQTTLAQRLVRAKRKIAKAGIAYKVPSAEELSARLSSVLAVIYLIYNESYNAFQGQTLSREELANEAIRLAEILQQLYRHPEVTGLLALMLLHQARSAARSDSRRAYIPLQQQDRGLWQSDKIQRARSMLLTALAGGRPGKYQIQAAISALHCDASSWEKTDWSEMYLLYETLYRFEPSAVVKLNSILVMTYQLGAKVAYPKLLELQRELNDYQPYWAARAELESKLGKSKMAAEHYLRAIKLSHNDAEKQFLNAQLRLVSNGAEP